MPRRGIWVALVAAVLLAAPAGAGMLQSAIEARDVLKLEKLSRLLEAADGMRLATGAVLSLRHQDDKALAILFPLSLSATTPDVRAGACLALSDIYLRQGRYAEAHNALQCVEDASGKPLTGETLQVLNDTGVLAGAKPMQLTRPAAGRLDARRDEAGLVRVGVEINGQPQRAVIDTDASFCVLSETVAERLGVRVLDRTLTIVTSTRADQPMHLGIANQVKFGDAVLTNVVFAVLPDAAMRFGPQYRMDAAVGLPVLVALGRIELASEDGSEHLYYGARTEAPVAAEPNLVISGLDPFVLVKEAKTGAVLRLALDSAASNTTLNATVFKDYPALAEGTSSGLAQWEGAGGSATDYRARTMPELKLSLAGRQIVLKRVKILSSDEQDRHGAVGQDVLKQGRRWVLDFGNMSFEVAD